MDYALLTLYNSFESLKSIRPWMPRAFHQYILGMMPPATFGVPGGFIHGSGDGCIVVVPATREMMAWRNPSRVNRALERGATVLRRIAPPHVAIDPVLPETARGPTWLSGSSVAAAGVLQAFEQVFSATSARRLAGYEIAVIGTAFHETIALAECLSETVRGVNLTGGRPAAMERLATDFWRHASVASRIHKSVANACSRSRIVLVAGPLLDGGVDHQPLLLSPGSVLVELHPPWRASAGPLITHPQSALVQSPVLVTPQPLNAPVGVEPPALSSLVEAALASTSPETTIFARPSARDLRKVERALERHGVKTTSVWNTRNMMSLASLTPLLA